MGTLSTRMEPDILDRVTGSSGTNVASREIRRVTNTEQARRKAVDIRWATWAILALLVVYVFAHFKTGPGANQVVGSPSAPSNESRSPGYEPPPGSNDMRALTQPPITGWLPQPSGHGT